MTNTTLPNNFDAQSNGRGSSVAFVDEFMPRDPTLYDISYPIQKKWLNTLTNAFWELKNFVSAQGVTTANWVLLSNESAVAETLTGNDGIIVPPTNNNINVLGDVTNILTTGNAGTSTLTINLNGNIANTYVCDVGSASPSGHTLNVLGSNGHTTVGSGNTITIDYYSLTPYIVGSDANSQYSTIQAAVTQAISDGASTSNPKNIHIKPKSGGYTENVTIVDGINLVGQGDQTTINGKISMSTAGAASIIGLTLKTNGDFCISITGSSATSITISNCNIFATNHTAISQSSSSGSSIIPINNCFFFILTTGITCWNSSSAGFISIVNCSSGNLGSSTTQSTNSAGFVNLFNNQFDFPISCTGTGSLNLVLCTIQTAAMNVIPLTFNGVTSHTLAHSLASGGSASAVTIGAGSTATIQFLSAGSGNTNVLTGAGTMFYSFISFSGGSSGHNVNTETAIPTL